MKKTTSIKSKLTEIGQIVHRSLGRVRIRIPRLRYDVGYGTELNQAVHGLQGIIEVRINSLASSIIISYKSDELTEQAILDCLGVTIEETKKDPHSETPQDQAPESDLVEEAEELTAKVAGVSVGETIGEIIGETVGELLIGPVGMAIGAEVGATLGGEIGESIGQTVEKAIETESQNSLPKRNSQKNGKRRNP
jgi:copper chaperone CopZ